MRRPSNGVVDGDLWLVGGGDPLLMTDAYAQHFREPTGHPHVTSSSWPTRSSRRACTMCAAASWVTTLVTTARVPCRSGPTKSVTAHRHRTARRPHGERRPDAVPADVHRAFAARGGGRRSRARTPRTNSRNSCRRVGRDRGRSAADRAPHRRALPRSRRSTRRRSSRSSPRCSVRATTRPRSC